MRLILIKCDFATLFNFVDYRQPPQKGAVKSTLNPKIKKRTQTHADNQRNNRLRIKMPSRVDELCRKGSTTAHALEEAGAQAGPGRDAFRKRPRASDGDDDGKVEEEAHVEGPREGSRSHSLPSTACTSIRYLNSPWHKELLRLPEPNNRVLWVISKKRKEVDSMMEKKKKNPYLLEIAS